MGIYQAILLGNIELINFFEQHLIEEEEAIKNRKRKTRKLLETWEKMNFQILVLFSGVISLYLIFFRKWLGLLRIIKTYCNKTKEIPNLINEFLTNNIMHCTYCNSKIARLIKIKCKNSNNFYTYLKYSELMKFGEALKLFQEKSGTEKRCMKKVNVIGKVLYNYMWAHVQSNHH